MEATEWKQRVKKYKGIFTEPPQTVPSDKVVDSPVIGNGDLGVTISGRPDQQRVWISKTDFWKAQKMYPNGSPCLLGGIDIHIPDLVNASYYCEQRLDEAQIVSAFHGTASSVYITSWISALENALIIEFSCEGQAVSVKPDLWVQQGNGSETEYGQESNAVWATRRFSGDDIEWPTEGVIAMRSSAGSPSFTLQPGTKQYLVAYVMTNHDEENYLRESIRKVGLIDEKAIASLRSDHEDWWSTFWAKSAIDIGDELLEKFWYGSHYIMACCSRNKNFAPGLFGNWITTDTPEWAGDYHLNYNYQAPWWGVYSSNHIELSEPYDTPLLEYMSSGRRYAKEYLGIRGLYYDVGIGPKGLPTALCNTPYENGHMFLGQKSNSALSTVNMLMRFYYTYDLEYAGFVYPFLTEVADFWEDYLIFENGRYVIYHDAIHEVGTYTESHDDDHWDRGLEDMNPILSLALIRMLFKGLLDISRQLQLDAERREKWTHILEHISEYPTFEREGKTIFRLTEQGYDWWPDNTLAIQHIWPAGGIGLDSDPGLLEIAKNTITVLNRWTDYNGFPTIFTAAARVGYEPETILRELRRQCSKHSFPNLFIFFGGGGIECCSGVPATINEMLLQSHEQVIRLFPVWPRDKAARFHQLRAAGAFVISSELSGGKVTLIEITSEKGQDCRIFNPWLNEGFSLIEVDSKHPKEIEWKLSSDIISFHTEAGKSYALRHHES
ncbi:glycosyl hydrolase family 95 catalytic domain-containing protein [Paenibacillus glycanilyticus]|uniref:Uncharacterized protein n=1 Tax=Paenibacillus glycanilyticus TaxID=126569 RepID=A0ABQ6GCD6_9BACL|nr:hypothetical protein [Paenibacillus glycanilyticus]GLX67735.1 hypothetical protein MU1_20800 [Paenibacillus glycanilyticus]